MKYLKDILQLSYKKKKSIAGYLFILPFLIGFVFLILHPIINSIIFSLGELEFGSEGYSINFVGLNNYKFIFTVHQSFTQDLINSSITVMGNILWVLVFSFFAAVILNQKFKGRLLTRVIFFLPVILSSGILLELETNDYLMSIIQEGAEILQESEDGSGGLMFAQSVSMLLVQLRLPDFFMEFVIEAIENIPNIIRASGVQILIFLAGLQSIPPALYEAAKVDGSTAWEDFWKITLPLLSPLILTNIVYTIVDFFTSPRNKIVNLIQETTFRGRGFGTSSAMVWIYFIIISVLITIIIKSLSRFVFYNK